MTITIDGHGMELAALLGALFCRDEADDADDTNRIEPNLQKAQGLLKDIAGMVTNQTKADDDESKIGLPPKIVQQIVDELKAVEAKQTTQTSVPSAANQNKFDKVEAKAILDKIFSEAPPDFIGSLVKTASDTDSEIIVKAFKAMTLARIKQIETTAPRYPDEIRAVRECLEAILHWKL